MDPRSSDSRWPSLPRSDRRAGPPRRAGRESAAPPSRRRCPAPAASPRCACRRCRPSDNGYPGYATAPPASAARCNRSAADRAARGDPHVAQAQFLIHEVEVVVQALAVIRDQVPLAGFLVVPGLVGGAGLWPRRCTAVRAARPGGRASLSPGPPSGNFAGGRIQSRCRLPPPSSGAFSRIRLRKGSAHLA